MVYFLILVAILLLGIFGPVLAPYPYDVSHYDDQGLERLEGPSLKHPLGTTDLGMDILSRVLYGARPTVITGLLGGTIIISIGMVIGITAGYMGGYVESALMRFTDVVYGVPLIPFALVVIGFLGVGFIESIVTIGLILWRANARVLRSQVLQVKKRPYVQVARANGAGHARIVIKHILPNVAPMAVLFFSIGVGYSIIIQAGLAFLGVSNPFIPSWGIMVRNAYNSRAMADA
jgi:peptide/nickel transport system permease protein